VSKFQKLIDAANAKDLARTEQERQKAAKEWKKQKRKIKNPC
jgi:hypothetical protein